jgi:hypothetical protein
MSLHDDSEISWSIDTNPDTNWLNIVTSNYTGRDLINDAHYNNSRYNNSVYNNIDLDNIQLNDYNNIYNNVDSPWFYDPNYNDSIVTNIRTIRNNRNFDNIDDFIPFNTPNVTQFDFIVQEFLISEEDKTCCICMEERYEEGICRFNCHHLFCIECTRQHVKKNNSCPLCRTKIKNIQFQNNELREKF